MNINQEIQCYGCTIEAFKQSIEDTASFKVNGPGFIAISILSDVQEMMARGQNESARQAVNRVKWILDEYNCGIEPR